MNYIITYSALNNFGQVVKQGKMKVKNKLSSMHAKSSLEDYMRRKYIDFDRLIVYDCSEENETTKLFNDLFGTNFKPNNY